MLTITLDPVAPPTLMQSDVQTMREFYDLYCCLPTSERADTILIRSHIWYHSGSIAANAVKITPSRGHSYRVKGSPHHAGDVIVRITDHYDHRDGVHGWT